MVNGNAPQNRRGDEDAGGSEECRMNSLSCRTLRIVLSPSSSTGWSRVCGRWRGREEEKTVPLCYASLPFKPNIYLLDMRARAVGRDRVIMSLPCLSSEIRTD